MDEKLSRNEIVWLSLVGMSLFLGLWSVASVLEFAPRKFLPPPWEVLQRGWTLMKEPFSGHTLQGHLLSSIDRYVRGFLLAAVIGVPLGLIKGWYRWADNIVSPLFDARGLVAPIARVPFADL